MTSTTQMAAVATALEDNADKIYELVDGQLEVKDMGSSRHSGVGTRLIIEMGMHVKLNKLGGVYGPDATFQIGHNECLPDVSFISAPHIPSEGETEEKWHVAPDLAVEVISPDESWDKVNPSCASILPPACNRSGWSRSNCARCTFTIRRKRLRCWAKRMSW